MTSHWTERSTKDFLFSVAMDFIDQLQSKMKALDMSQSQLAEASGVSKGRISQVFNDPGNLSLATMIKLTRAVGMKVSIVAYTDNDPANERGPINSIIFTVCWERAGKPVDNWDLEGK